ncbi:acyl-CoA N-acyltransferase [Gymnopilus junonius]|uniref:Acyl-CoA N-acyltransferase n=1 Tax=Gymnopilus junonius TaxID=109634 RepID=A0A9P5TQQ0_GYMJU|nr:acyl-CoA N-acyltransferase [Gymnopilus junonius]
MSFINSYKGPKQSEVDISRLLTTEPGEFDVNSSIPVPTNLESERVHLVPFIPSLHAEVYYEGLSKDPDFAQYLPFAFPTFESLLLFLESFIRQDPSSVVFAIIDKTKTPAPSSLESKKIPNGRLAGMIGWLHGSPQNLSLEIGPVVILPEFQRTFVSANAIGLLLKYVLDLPHKASPLNKPSIRAAEKMGFVKEGVSRWTWVLSETKKGKKIDSGRGRGDGDGRDSVFLSLCWDDWEGGVRGMVLKRMERV